jgi:hypothetical protein
MRLGNSSPKTLYNPAPTPVVNDIPNTQEKSLKEYSTVAGVRATTLPNYDGANLEIEIVHSVQDFYFDFSKIKTPKPRKSSVGIFKSTLASLLLSEEARATFRDLLIPASHELFFVESLQAYIDHYVTTNKHISVKSFIKHLAIRVGFREYDKYLIKNPNNYTSRGDKVFDSENDSFDQKTGNFIGSNFIKKTYESRNSGYRPTLYPQKHSAEVQPYKFCKTVEEEERERMMKAIDPVLNAEFAAKLNKKVFEATGKTQDEILPPEVRAKGSKSIAEHALRLLGVRRSSQQA